MVLGFAGCLSTSTSADDLPSCRSSSRPFCLLFFFFFFPVLFCCFTSLDILFFSFHLSFFSLDNPRSKSHQTHPESSTFFIHSGEAEASSTGLPEFLVAVQLGHKPMAVAWAESVNRTGEAKTPAGVDNTLLFSRCLEMKVLIVFTGT